MIGVDKRIILLSFSVSKWLLNLIDWQVPAQFAFIAKLDETEYCKPWLTIRPCFGIIFQGTVNDLLTYLAFFKGCLSFTYFQVGQWWVDVQEDIASLTRPIYPTHPQSKNLNPQIRQENKLRLLGARLQRINAVAFGADNYVSLYIVCIKDLIQTRRSKTIFFQLVVKAIERFGTMYGVKCEIRGIFLVQQSEVLRSSQNVLYG